MEVRSVITEAHYLKLPSYARKTNTLIPKEKPYILPTKREKPRSRPVKKLCKYKSCRVIFRAKFPIWGSQVFTNFLFSPFMPAVLYFRKSIAFHHSLKLHALLRVRELIKESSASFSLLFFLLMFPDHQFYLRAISQSCLNSADQCCDVSDDDDDWWVFFNKMA